MSDLNAPPTYMKQCAFMGLDLGFWIFKNKEMEVSELKKYCGYDTKFDAEQGRCVARETPVCAAIPISSDSTIEEKSDTCGAVAGCSLSMSEDSCEALAPCTVSLDDNAETQERSCKANPNCEWDPEGPFACSEPHPGLLAPDKLKPGCDAEAVHISNLCGEGTVFHKDFKQCVLPEKNTSDLA